MFISVPILLIFMLCFFIVGKNNRYISILLLPTLSISFFMLFLGIYVFKITSYTGLLLWEHQFYYFIIQLPINYYLLTNILNLTVAFHMFMMWLVGAWFLFPRSLSDRKINKLWYLTLLIPIILYGIICTNGFCCNLFLYTHMSSDISLAYGISKVAPALDVLKHITVLAYVIMPIIIIAKRSIKEHFIYNKRVLQFTQITLVSINLVFIFSYKIGMMDLQLNSFQNLLRHSTETIQIAPSSYVLFITVLIFILLVLIGIIKYRMWYVLVKLNVFMTNKNKKVQYDDVRCMAHSFKTSMYSIIINLHDAEKCEDIEEIKDEIKYITDWSSDELKHIEEFLDIFKDGYSYMMPHNIIEIINNVLNETLLPHNIVFKNNIPFDTVVCRMQKFAFAEAIKNIISNSVDAIGDLPNGEISLYAECDNSLLNIGIRDNGCGIDKKHLRHIFDPLYSTKHSRVNWGIGLSQVKNTIKNFGGLVFAASKPNEFTEIQISLPYSHKVTSKNS